MQHPNVSQILFYASQKLFITYNTHILIIDTFSLSIRSFWEFIVTSRPKKSNNNIVIYGFMNYQKMISLQWLFSKNNKFHPFLIHFRLFIQIFEQLKIKTLSYTSHWKIFVMMSLSALIFL